MTWTAPEVDRRSFALVGDERTMLQSFLDRSRDTLLWKCQGLSAVQLTSRSVEPSSMSLLGLVRHMTEVERGWFRQTAAGERVDYIYCDETNRDGDFDDISASDAEADIARYREEIALCDKAVAGLPVEYTVKHPRSGRDLSLRWIYLHMIEEYSRHLGHADLLRERLDRVVGY
ncbi:MULTISPECIES: DinB family protein [unclassified Nocardia]|uniref:DinB family protein n=1 Tax=unclassified Nocardia TaxID=2637762 RepID=UPI0024A80049|nr:MULTISPECIES: DinB family protein [unclassified Nocardia]